MAVPASRILSVLGLDVATSYPSDGIFNYPVTYLPGAGVANAVFGNVDAARQQSLDEHNSALTKYVRPGMNPLQLRWAIQRGKEDEAKLPQFWAESTPRRNVRPSSNMMSGLRINPDNTISIQFGGSGKWYTYRGGPDRHAASIEAQKLVGAPDIESALTHNGSWSLSHKLF